MGGFGRFVKADAATRAMTDLRAFRCQVILDSLRDVPQNLSVVLGEEAFSVMLHIESWEWINNGGVATRRLLHWMDRWKGDWMSTFLTAAHDPTVGAIM